MTPLPLWPTIEPAPISRRMRRRPSRKQIEASLALADALHGALEPDQVAAELGIKVRPGNGISRAGRVVRLDLGPHRFVIVVRCLS